ncbi:MAG: Ig-like domain-containing protein [Pirellulales bacterium]|nr:Ig-like domain-containing protein [Pirellulales bacterium]
MRSEHVCGGSRGWWLSGLGQGGVGRRCGGRLRHLGVETLEDRRLLSIHPWLPTAQVAPEDPMTGELVEIGLSGQWPTACVPDRSSVEMVGNSIYFDVYDPYTQNMCIAIPTPWSLSETVGTLAEGDYTVLASLYSNRLEWPAEDYYLEAGPVAVADFSVTTPIPDPPTNVRLAPRSDTGASDSDGITNTYSPELIWDPSTSSNVVGYEVVVVGSSFWVTEPQWFWPFDSFFPEGDHTATVRAQNRAGRLSEPAVYEFTVDYTGPRIIAHEPHGTIPRPTNEVSVTFNEPIHERTFTVEDVMVTADALLLYIPVTDVSPVGENSYRITFEGPGLPVDYHVWVGPAIEDLAGNEMDQNQDRRNGQPDDVYDADFVVGPLPPDLYEWSGLIEFAPAAVHTGDPLEVAWTVSNNAVFGIPEEPPLPFFGPAHGPWDEAVFLSEDGTWDADDLLLGTATFDGVLMPGEGARFEETFQVPEDLAPGDYHVIAYADYVAGDPAGQVEEWNEENNWDVARGTLHVAAQGPRVVGLWPAPGSTELLVSGVRAEFSEPLAFSTINAHTFWLSSDPGPDGEYGTSDDTRVEGGVTYEPASTTASFTTLVQRLPAGTYAVVIEDEVTNLQHAALDGEGDYAFPLPVDDLPSGDGTSGGDFLAMFAVEATPAGTIRGSKFEDLDGDAIWDDGEPALPEWTIYLDENRNGQLDPDETATRTNADGHYAFTNLPPGEYTVAEVLAEGWRQTSPGAEPGREFQVNTQTTGEQLCRAMATGPGGGFVVAWQSNPHGDDSDVHARLFGSDGRPLGPEFQVNTCTEGNQAQPTVAADAAGNFVIAWASMGQDGDDWGIFAQRFLADGTPLGPEFPVNATTGGEQWTPSVGMAPDGRFVVAWAGQGSDVTDPGEIGVYGQRFDAFGERLGDEFRADTFPGGTQSMPSVAVAPNGSFVIVWSGFGSDPNECDRIFVRRFRPNGVPYDQPFRVDADTFDCDYAPSVAMDAAGNFTVVWDRDTLVDCGSAKCLGYADVVGRMYWANGTARGIEFRVNADDMINAAASSVAVDGEGRFVVVWTSDAWDANGRDVYARTFLPDGTPYGDQFRVHANPGGNQYAGAVAMGDGGRFVATWNDLGHDTDVFARQFEMFASAGVHEVVLRTGDVVEGIDFGNLRPGSVCGAKFHDLDGDGVWDDGEPGLEGWTVYLDLNGDGQPGAATSGVSRELQPNDFGGGPIVDPEGFVKVQEGMSQTDVIAVPSLLDPLPTAEYVFGWVGETGDRLASWSETNAVLQIGFAEPVSAVALDFVGAYRGGHQGQLRAYDAGGNLLVEQLTEVIWGLGSETLIVTRSANEIAMVEATGLSDWAPVMLDRLRFSLQGEPGEPQTTTGAHGEYCFESLPPGTYTVAEVLPEGWRQTLPGVGAELLKPYRQDLHEGAALDFHVSEVAADARPDGTLTAEITLEVLWPSTNYFLVPEGTSYTVNGDEIAITLYSGMTIDVGLPVLVTEWETVSIDGLSCGTYHVVATLMEPAGPMLPAFFASWEAGADMVLAYPGTYTVTLQSSDAVDGLDFGNRFWTPEGELHGTKFYDADGDGMRDDGEPGLPGWTIYLDQDHDGQYDPPRPGFDRQIDPWATMPPGPIEDPLGFAALREVIDGGPVVIAAPVLDPAPISERVFGWINDVGEEMAVWSETTAVLEVTFAEPVSSVSLDFLAIGVWGCHEGRLQAWDASGELLQGLRTELLCGYDSQTLTVDRSANAIARITATGSAEWIPLMIDRLQFSRLEEPGEPATTTDDYGDYSFVHMAPGDYMVAEVLPDGWQQTMPGPHVHLDDADSQPIGTLLHARAFGVSEATAGAIATGHVAAEITVGVVWENWCSSLMFDMTTASVDGERIGIRMFGYTSGICPTSAGPRAQQQTIVTPALTPGTYSVLVTLYESGPSMPPYQAWEATATLTVTAGGTYEVTLEPFEVLSGLDFGNRRAIQVVGRHVFYNNSSWDGDDPAPNARDNQAVATDKHALLPGETATFANYTNYSRGINGVMVDLAGMDSDIATLVGCRDFEFRVGNNNDPSTWPIAPEPISITVQPGDIPEGSRRVTIIWPDNAIAKQWLQVRVLATPRTGLAEDDVFYFGNAVGDAGNSTTDARVNAVDMLLARNNPRHFLDSAAIECAYDYNRDARVDATDMLIARNNQTHFLNDLNLIEAPLGKATAVKPLQPRELLFDDMVWLYELERLRARPQVMDDGSRLDSEGDLLAAYGTL